MRKYIIFLLTVIIFIISCNSNNEKPKTINTSPQTNQIFKSEKKETTVTFNEARRFVQDRISMRNGRIIDEFINNSYGHKIYIFLTEYGSESCNISVSELELTILATKCGQDALAYFYAAKMTSNKENGPSRNIEPINDTSDFSMYKISIDTSSFSEYESSESQFKEYESVSKKERYIINASEKHKVYFHKFPNTEFKKNTFINTKELVIVERIDNGFGYIEFINTSGQKSVGWIEMQYLTKYKP